MQLDSRQPRETVQHHFFGVVTQRLGHVETLRNNICRTRRRPVCQGLQAQPLQESKVDIHSPYQLQEEQIKCYGDSGFVRLRSVFDHATLAHYTPAVSLEVAHADKTPLEEDSDYQKAFTQVLLFCPCATNFSGDLMLHRLSVTIFRICRSRIYGLTASQLKNLF